MKLSKNLTGIVLGLVVVILVAGRDVPRALQGSHSLGVIVPVVGVLIVGVFVVVLALRKPAGRKPRPSHRRRPRR